MGTHLAYREGRWLVEAPTQIGSLERSVEPALVLIVAAEKELAVPWLQAIRRSGPLSIWSDSADGVERHLRELPLRAAVMDIAVPHVWELVTALIVQGTPVVAVADTPSRRIAALDRGCAEALPKNSSPEEISRGVRRVWRNAHETSGLRGQVKAGPLLMDCTSRKTIWHGKQVPLGRTLFNLLGFLAQHPGEPFGTQELLSKVWMDPYKTEGTVWTAIKKLRLTLEDHGHIVNRTGFGYCFLPEEPEGVMTAEQPEVDAQAS
jgi:DNA-binding response OmpR family regulator